MILSSFALVQINLLQASLLIEAAVDQKLLDDVYSRYKSIVNMTASELREWAKTKASKRASEGRGPIQRNLELLETPKAKWTAKHVEWANRTISFVSRMKGVSKGKPLSKEVPMSKRDISLKNWAFDPNK